MIWSRRGVKDVAGTHSFSTIDTRAPIHTGGRRRATRALALTVTALLTAGSALAARSFTVTVVAAHGPITDLLPASTVLYAGATVEPDGGLDANLHTIEQAFSAQPGFGSTARRFTSLLSSTANTLSCNADSRPIAWNSQLSSWINGTFAVAVTNPAAFRDGGMTRAVQDNAVVVVGLKVRRPLADILTQHQLGSATRALRYGGIDLYAVQRSPACTTSPSSMAALAYAAVLNGYAVVGLTPRSVEREIDVYRSATPSLSQSATYRQVTRALAPDGLAFVYLNTPALLQYVPSAGSLFSRLSGLAPAGATR
jgi:hypothetical protein